MKTPFPTNYVVTSLATILVLGVIKHIFDFQTAVLVGIAMTCGEIALNRAPKEKKEAELTTP